MKKTLFILFLLVFLVGTSISSATELCANTSGTTDNKILSEKQRVVMDGGLSLDYADDFIVNKEDSIYWHVGSLNGGIEPRSIPGIDPEYIMLNVQKLYQGGSSAPWRDDPILPCNHPMWRKGCAITSFTMSGRYYGVLNLDPGQVNTVMGTRACPFDWPWAGSNWGLKIVRHAGLGQGDFKQIILGALRLGHVSAVCVERYSDGQTHFVIAKGYRRYETGHQEFYINDPESQWDYPTLETYLNNGWFISTVRVISKN